MPLPQFCISILQILLIETKKQLRVLAIQVFYQHFAEKISFPNGYIFIYQIRYLLHSFPAFPFPHLSIFWHWSMTLRVWEGEQFLSLTLLDAGHMQDSQQHSVPGGSPLGSSSNSVNLTWDSSWDTRYYNDGWDLWAKFRYESTHLIPPSHYTNV